MFGDLKQFLWVQAAGKSLLCTKIFIPNSKCEVKDPRCQVMVGRCQSEQILDDQLFRTKERQKMPVSLSMATMRRERSDFSAASIAESAARLNVMNLKTLDGSTRLATPAVSL